MESVLGKVFTAVLIALLLQDICLCALDNFAHDRLGVIFDPLIKENITWEDQSTYETYENVQTMLKVVTRRFTTIFAEQYGVFHQEYVYNHTYYNGAYANVYTSEIAALINKERNAQEICVFLGVGVTGNPKIAHTEVLVTLESAEKANSIFPGTVKGIMFFVGYKDSLEKSLPYIRALRNNATQLGIKLGGYGYCNGYMNPSNETQYNLEREFVVESDFFLCHVSPGPVLLEKGPIDCFSSIISNFEGYTANMRKVKPDFDVMLWTDWTNTDTDNLEGVQNLSTYWETASSYALEKNMTIVMSDALDNGRAPPSDLQMGWWNLTDDSRMNNDDAYIEIISLLPPIHRDPDTPSDEPSMGQVIIVISVLAAIILCVVLASILVVTHKRKRERLYSSQVQNFFNGAPKEDEMSHDGACAAVASALSLPYDSSYEFTVDMLNIETNKMLGRGNFGHVYKATIKVDGKSIDVALKMTTSKTSHTAINALLAEIKILTYLGKHANIVAMKGAFTSELANGVVYLATELCSLGSLEEYLSTNPFYSESNNNDENNKIMETYVSVGESITLDDMLRWSYEIACGMEYLGSKNVVHADLATRNVLLTATKTAKISDFGLSRRMYNYQKYVKKWEEPLPWRWMAIESLRKCEFSAESDVWSYGITIWEIFSMGETPYPGMSWTPDFADKLTNGLRLECPKFATREMFNIMTMCWNVNPRERISFTSLREHIDDIIQRASVSREQETYAAEVGITDDKISLDEKNRHREKKLTQMA